MKEKSRIRAEEAMVKLDRLVPVMKMTREMWMRVLVEYEDEMQLLRQYKKRGIVSEEEVERYSVSGYKKVSFNELLKKYREEKRDEVRE